MAETERVAGMIFHTAQIIADEAIARDWSIWDFADRVGMIDPSVCVLAYGLHAATVEMPDEIRSGCHMGSTFAGDMQRVFGIDAEVWERTEALCKRYPDRIAPLDAAAREWYGLDDEMDEPASTPSSPGSEP